MNVAVLLFTDGRRDYIQPTIASLEQRLWFGHRSHRHARIIVDDSADPSYAAFLDLMYGDKYEIRHHRVRLGFAGTIQDGWNALPAGTTHVWHAEDDFTLNQDVRLDDLVTLLEQNPHLVQVALKRQAWNEAERAAGGLVELRPDNFVEVPTPFGPLTTHRSYFTTNPSLYRVSLIERGWPQVPNSEGVFTHGLLVNPDAHFAMLGGKFAPPKCEHIGAERAGTGY